MLEITIVLVSLAEQIIGCRRLYGEEVGRDSAGKSVADEFIMLKQRAHAARMRMSIAARGLMSYDAFRMFDYSRTVEKNSFVVGERRSGSV